MTGFWEVTLENPPLESVPVHGSGLIERLLDAFTAVWILRINHIRSTLVAQHLAPASTGALGAVADYLLELPRDQACAKLLNPIFAAWVVRLWNGVFGSQRAETESHSEWLIHHIESVRIILLAEMPRLRALGASAGPITLSTDRAVAPLGVGWRLTAGPALRRPVELVDNSRNIEVIADGNLLCRIPWSEVCLYADGRSIESHWPEAITVEQRSYLLDGRVEILVDGAFPELSRRRTPEERPCALDCEALKLELDRAIRLIRTVWPEALADVAVLFRGLLPIQMTGNGWNSASTGEVPFVLQLTFRKNGWSFLLADSILHEVAHTKMDMAMTLTPLLLDDGRKIYRHPWRPDLRPITGVLLGAHAFLAVLSLYHRALRIWPEDAAIRQQFEQRRSEVLTAVAILADAAEFTPAGAFVFQAMRNALTDCNRI
jgi:HEXXH motif-containing protein